MFVRQLCRIFTRFPESFKRKVIRSRTFCTTHEENSTNENKEVVDKLSKQGDKHVWKKEAQEFMMKLDDESLKAKSEIEILWEVMKQENEDVPEFISPWDWKILITECHSYISRVKYLNYLHRRSSIFLHLKQQEIQKLERLEKNMMETEFEERKRVKQKRKWKRLEALRSNIPVVLDLNFDSDIRQQRLEYEYIRKAWQANLSHLQPLDLHFTSVHKNYRMKEIFEGNDLHYISSLHEEHFLDIFSHKDLVYLTPDGPPMFNFDQTCIYVLGAISKLTPLITFSMAREYGIRYASLPLTTYYRLGSGAKTGLDVDVAYKILLDMYLTNSWHEAFSNNLSKDYYFLRDEFKRQENVEEKMGDLHSVKSTPISSRLLNILSQK